MRPLAKAGERRREHDVSACSQPVGDASPAPAPLPGAVDKIKVGLQQLMAGSRNWEVRYISRKDIFSLTEECSKITGIPYVMDAFREEALGIIDA